MRSFGILSYAAMIDSKESAQRLSDVRLGIDLGLIQGITPQCLNELMVLTQPGFVYRSFNGNMEIGEMDMFRARLIREKLGKSVK
jgi:protein arginine kinase